MVAVRLFISKLICCKIGDGLTDLEGVVAAIVIDIMVVALGVGYLLPEASKSGGLLPAAVFAMLVVLSLLPWIVMLKS